jgi:predicted permease
LVAAGLTLVSLQQLMRVNPGFARQNAICFRVDPYPNAELTQRVIAALSQVPGVRLVGGANIELLHDLWSNGVRITTDAGSAGNDSAAAAVDYWRVTTDYFAAAGIPLIAGRPFNIHDGFDVKGGRCVIINEALAKRFFPHQDAIGKRIRLLPRPGVDVQREIIGVVGSIKHRGLEGEGIPILYVHAQDAPALTVSTTAPLAAVLPALRDALRKVDSELIMSRVSTTEQIVTRSLADRRFATLLIFVLAAIGTALAAGGLYGVMSYAVGQRTREIGLRMALGARRGEVLGMILRQGMALAATGIGVGLMAGFAVGRLIRSLLFNVSPSDPTMLATIMLLLCSIALLACWIPAHRAAKIHPMEALRCE